MRFALLPSALQHSMRPYHDFYHHHHHICSVHTPHQ